MIPRRPAGGPARASFAQQRLWLIDQLEQGETAYSVLIPTRLRGTLSIGALANALATVTARHDVLRTSYQATDGTPRQVVHPAEPLRLPLTDLSGLPAAERSEAVRQWVREEETQRFDLATGPVIRARLLRLAAEDHVLLCGVHHIAVDVPSIHLFYDELASCYNAHVCGGQPRLPELAIQYADFAEWERDRLAGPERERLLGYWRGQLDRLPALDLPTDRPAPAGDSTAGGFVGLDLPPGLLADLETFARARRIDLFDVLVAGLCVVLSRYCGQDDISLGTVLHRRPQPELRPLIGFFANTVVLRVDASGRPAFGDLACRVAAVTQAAREHGELPFDMVVQELRPRRGGSRSPLFRVYFGLDETPEVLPRMTGLDVTGMLPDFATTKFDLGFKIRATAHDSTGPKMFSVFSLDLFSEEMVERMLEHFRTVLEDGVAHPGRPVTELAMLTAAERQQAAITWNDTAQPFPSQACLHELFEAQASSQPGAPAVICDGDVLSYAALETQANQVAHRLRALGVRPGTLVALCLRRGVRSAVAMLGVLKAGGAYLPLDPDHPPQRLRALLTDAAAWGVITDQPPGGTPDGPPAPPGMTVVDLADAGWAGGPAHRPAGQATPDDLAYVIYTSGSTGTPKGIEITHRGVVNNFTDINRRFRIGPGDVVLGVSSPSFDMSAYDCLGMLAAGGTLVLPGPAGARSPAAWAGLIRRHSVTVWHSAPALLELLLEQEERHAAPGGLPLRLVLLGGDWIPLSMPDRVRRQAAGAEVIALGGATEASMDSTIFPVAEVSPSWTSIPYGRPLANQRAYVLDRHGQLLPPGVPGELHLAGTGLARGYRGDPALTAERFVERTIDDGAGGRQERLYRTGDLVRYRPDGVLELLGRTDFQVKIHGLRIELGEIETALRRHDAVGDAVVVARGERGHTTLAAFIRPAGDALPPGAELRRWLASTLPEPMVPASIVKLAQFPVSPNGKVDRGALRAWQPGGQADRAPQDALEAQISAVWQEVLGIDQAGADDDFFALGGDSFAAVRVMLALDEPVPVVELFKNPTVRSLARRIRSAHAGAARLLYRLTPERDTRLSLLCLPYGGGNAVSYRQLAEAVPPEFALWAAALPGHDPGTRDQPFLAFSDAAKRLADEARERISGPLVIYGHCAGAVTGVALARELASRGADLRAVYVAASLPDHDPARSLRRAEQMSDRRYADYLAGIGGFTGALDSLEVEIIMRAGRHDMVEATLFFQHDPGGDAPLGAPVHCVIGDQDPTTEGFQDRFRHWEAYVHRQVDLSVIAGGDHYFVRSHADELGRLLSSQLRDS